MIRPAPLFLLPVLTAGPTGCTSLIERVIARAPNHGHPAFTGEDPLPEEVPPDPGCRALRVEVGPPAASLSLWVLEPRPPDPAPPRGTILLLYGWRKTKAKTLRLAKVLREAGYRVVPVDLRGHGRSSGEWLTYGTLDSRDLSQVLDALEEKGLAAGPIGVFGISYGAAAAIQFAARDRRISAVVSVASFSRLRSTIPHYVRLFLPVTGWFMSEEQIQAAIDRAAQRAGFDPDEADVIKAMARVEAPVLLLHGDADWLIPPHHARSLFNAGNASAQLLFMAGYGHNSIYRDSCGEVARETLAWFARWLCPVRHFGVLKRKEAVLYER